MSISVAVSKPPKPASTTSSSLSETDAEELRQLDAAVERIRKAIPETPYILTAPCAEPRYHYPSRQEADSWRKNTPFQPHEEHLQYMSFIYREHEDSCFTVRTQVDEEREKRERAMKANGNFSGTSTPLQSTGAKKKISLSAYKNKQSGIKQEDAQKDGLKNGVQANIAQAKTQSDAPQDGEALSAQARGVKRTFEDSLDAKRSQESRSSAQPPPAKKVRPSSPTLNAQAGSKTEGTDNVHGLPPLLSPPILPERYDLPPLLSPTLPANVEVEITKLSSQSNNSDSSNPPSTQKSVASKSTNSTQPTESPSISATKAVKRTSSGEEKSSLDKSNVKASHNPTAHEPEIKHKPRADSKLSDAKPGNPIVNGETNGLHRPHDSAKPSSVTKEEERPTAIVKLKYGRRHRKDVERVLKLPPRKHPEAAKKAVTSEASAATKQARPETIRETYNNKKTEPAVKDRNSLLKEPPKLQSAAKVSPSINKTATEKRPRANTTTGDVDSPPNKKIKAASKLDLDRQPRTPTQRPTPSPATSQPPSAQRQLTGPRATPRKDFRAVIMSSSIGSDPATPTGGASPKTNGIPARAPTSAGTTSHAKHEWGVLQNKLSSTARDMKHEMQDMLKQDDISEAQREHAAVLNLQCSLLFMLTFVAADYRFRAQSVPPDSKDTWETLLKYMDARQTVKVLRRFPDLDGLRLRLHAVIACHIGHLYFDRMIVNHAHPNHAPTNAEGLRVARVFVEMHTTITTGTNLLPDKSIEEQYEHTANNVADGDLPAYWETLQPGRTQGKYWLYPGPDTPPLQAVRFGAALLSEYMSKHRIPIGLHAELKATLEQSEV